MVTLHNTAPAKACDEVQQTRVNRSIMDFNGPHNDNNQR